MTSADNILDQIDAALYDVTVSADAMRSRPEPEAPRPQAAVASGAREILIQRLIERHGLTRMTARHAVLAAERGSDSERAELVRAEARAVTAEMFARIRFAFQPMAEAAITALKQLSESIARLRADSHAFRHLPEAVGCNECRPPAPPADRPAWQSKYGPARRRR